MKAHALKASALKALGSRQIASIARNYYLTQALEVMGKLYIGMMKIPDKSLLKKWQVSDIFNAMAVKLVPEKKLSMSTK